MTAAARIPDVRHFLNPVLTALQALGGSATTKELYSRVASEMQLNEELFAVMTDPELGSMTEVEHCVFTATFYLKTDGLIASSARGVWTLTPRGVLEGRVDARDVIRRVKATSQTDLPRSTEPEASQRDLFPPAEDPWNVQMLKALHQLSPGAFERVMQLALRERGFIEVQVTGRSGDGGIDGVGAIRHHGLLTSQVVFQCKRWSDAVGPSPIRDFRGAMSGRASYGIFVTTSTFTPGAHAEATRTHPAIDLLDGARLCNLLKELGLGATIETIERVTVDHSWFRSLESRRDQ